VCPHPFRLQRRKFRESLPRNPHTVVAGPSFRDLYEFNDDKCDRYNDSVVLIQ